MRFVLICLAAVLLCGCGYIAGKRVDFGSDYSKYPDSHIQALAGKTFYISNNEDYERLILLKKELRELSNSPTPTKSLQADCVRDILQITNGYDSGYLGFFYWGNVSEFMGKGMDGSWADSIWCVVKFFIILLAPILVTVGTVAAIGDFIKGLFKQSK